MLEQETIVKKIEPRNKANRAMIASLKGGDVVTKLANQASDYHKCGKLKSAYATYKKLLRWRDADPNLHNNLGLLAMQIGRLPLADAHLADALRIQPDFPQALVNRALVSIELGSCDTAVGMLDKAIVLRPGDPGAINVLGNALQKLGRLDDAVAAYRKALFLSPGYPKLRVNLANALLQLGFADEALAHLQNEHSTRPGDARLFSQLLMARNYLVDEPAEGLFDQHVKWGTRFGPADEPWKSQRMNRSVSEGRLRVGYVSPDLREHSVASFLVGLFAEHDAAGMELACYADLEHPDDITSRLKASAGIWRDIRRRGDEQVAAQIRRDKIDVLVDLSGHTAGNRLSLFALRPAPVQVTYLGYPNTTGSKAIDFRITDWLADPEGEEKYHSEKLIRLPRCFLAYSPPTLPSDKRARDAGLAHGVTFGSFNNLLKVNQPVVDAWARILDRVPGSRLLLKSKAFGSNSAVERIQLMFRQQGIDRDRLILKGFSVSQLEHLAHYESVDIALDTFPYNGTTTTCEALWMGVPVVALAGRRHRERVGKSLLNAAGFPELVAPDVDRYIECAVALGNDRAQLLNLKAKLREKVARSPLCDTSSLAASLAAAFRSALYGRTTRAG